MVEDRTPVIPRRDPRWLSQAILPGNPPRVDARGVSYVCSYLSSSGSSVESLLFVQVILIPLKTVNYHLL